MYSDNDSEREISEMLLSYALLFYCDSHKQALAKTRTSKKRSVDKLNRRVTNVPIDAT